MCRHACRWSYGIVLYEIFTIGKSFFIHSLQVHLLQVKFLNFTSDELNEAVTDLSVKPERVWVKTGWYLGSNLCSKGFKPIAVLKGNLSHFSRQKRNIRHQKDITLFNFKPKVKLRWPSMKSVPPKTTGLFYNSSRSV